MNGAAIRDAARADFAAICDLNFANVQHTSPMDVSRLELLHSLTCYHKVASVGDEVAAFLIAMKAGAPYENANFAWFSHRFASLIYVDRIVVSDKSRGLKLGSNLYDDLFNFA